MSDDTGARIAALARGWIGTPFRHGAAVRGVGCDCLGLLRGIRAEWQGSAPDPVPCYGADWAAADPQRLARALAGHLRAIDPAQALAAGQVALLRLRAGGAGVHLGIVTLAPGAASAGRIVHAYGRHGVVESPLGEPWMRRIVARFSLI